MTTDDRWQGQTEADADLRARLESYAETALAPDATATARARAAVMAEARRRTADAAPADAAQPSVTPRPALMSRRPRFRLALGPGLLAAALLVVLVGVGGVLASTAGGPLYGLRLWAEELTLPAEPAARVGAQLARLDERLGEAEEGAESGNGGAVSAALEAYRSGVESALAAAGNDPGRRAEVAGRLEAHRAVLAALAGRLPEQATEAILANLARTEAKILEALGATPRPGEPGGPAATGAPHKTPPGKPEATPTGRPAEPAATPAPTPKPDKTPPGKPDETPKPGRTPPVKPDETPKP